MINKRIDKSETGTKAASLVTVGAVSGLRRLEPSAKMPPESLLSRFSTRERQRMVRRLAEAIEFINDAAFARRDALGLLVALPQRPAISVPVALDEDVPSPQRQPTLRITAAEETIYFRRYNYCRYRMVRLLKPYKGKRLTAGAARELLAWDAEASATRNVIAQANLGLVPAMLKRCHQGAAEMGDLIGEGYLALLRAIDKFDYARGFKFSTYACRAILSSFARQVYVAGRDRRHAPTEFDPRLETPEVAILPEQAYDAEYLVKLRCVIDTNRANLNDVERDIIRQRFGLDRSRNADDSAVGMTLGEIAAPIGLTRERVRQIQNNALTKLRTAMIEPIAEN